METGNTSRWHALVATNQLKPVVLGELSALLVKWAVAANARNRERNVRLAAIEARLTRLEKQQSNPAVKWMGIHSPATCTLKAV